MSQQLLNGLVLVHSRHTRKSLNFLISVEVPQKINQVQFFIIFDSVVLTRAFLYFSITPVADATPDANFSGATRDHVWTTRWREVKYNAGKHWLYVHVAPIWMAAD